MGGNVSELALLCSSQRSVRQCWVLAESSSWWWRVSASVKIPEQRARTLRLAASACRGQSRLRTRELRSTRWVAVYSRAPDPAMFNLEKTREVSSGVKKANYPPAEFTETTAEGSQLLQTDLGENRGVQLLCGFGNVVLIGHHSPASSGGGYFFIK